VGCEDGPTPCGGSITIDLADYNTVTASPCGVVYSIREFDTDAFSSVTTTEEGVVTITASDNFVRSTEFEIQYKAKSPCSILGDIASIFVCMQDTCRDIVCPEDEQCICGVCEPLGSDVEITE
jgi:hypothetical protein